MESDGKARDVESGFDEPGSCPHVLSLWRLVWAFFALRVLEYMGYQRSR
jgi:hypothetical protein